MDETPGRTELDAHRPEETTASGWLSFVRHASVFTRGAADRDHLRARGRSVRLVSDQIHHPPVSADLVVRRGKLRVTGFLADGREIVLAILQAGAVLRTRPEATSGEIREFPLDDLVLMALGDAELWSLPAGTLDPALANLQDG